MGDKTYFVLATIFNHWKLIMFSLVLILISSDVLACSTVAVNDTTVINCTGCK